MRAISLQQPMAWAIFHATPPKDVENRTKPVIPRGFRGRIAIHASAKTPPAIFASYAQKILDVTGLYPAHYVEGLAYGAILGTAEIVGCVTSHPSPWFVGPIGYMLANPRPLVTPIPCRGALGLWTVPPAIVADLATAEYRRAA